jgi:hypothetical protein
MPPCPDRSAAILALVLAGFTTSASAAAGRVDFVIGGVTVAPGGGQARPLARGAELEAGDVVRTNEGRIQIRFADGAYVSLQPQSEFNINEYRFEGKADGSERGFFGLLKGAMRTVTGAIGLANRGAYRLTTPTATIGIRGTGGVIEVLPDGSTLVIGTSGTWFVANQAGTLDVPAGTSVLAPADRSQPPRESSTQPTSGPAPLPAEPLLFVQGEQVNAIGVPLGLIDPLVSGSGYAAIAAPSAALDVASNTTAVFDTVGQMTSMTFGSGSLYALVAGQHADFGTDGVLAWGRWTGTATVPGPNGPITASYDGSQGMHYVIGLPTPTMPTTGGGTYVLTGATSPTYVGGKTAPGSFSGSLSVDFNQGVLGMNLNVAMPDGSYDLTGSASARASQFTASLTCTNRSCGGIAQGFFSGANAERAGLGYHIQDSASGDIVGAAAFRKQ